MNLSSIDPQLCIDKTLKYKLYGRKNKNKMSGETVKVMVRVRPMNESEKTR